MNEIRWKDKLYAIHDTLAVVEPNKSVWYGTKDDGIQVQRMCYDYGKTFKLHRHKKRSRTSEVTQEAFVIVKGCMFASIFTEDKEFLRSVILREGDVLILYAGAHKFSTLQKNTICYEFKNGPYTTAKEDKEVLE